MNGSGLDYFMCVRIETHSEPAWLKFEDCVGNSENRSADVLISIKYLLTALADRPVLS